MCYPHEYINCICAVKMIKLLKPMYRTPTTTDSLQLCVIDGLLCELEQLTGTLILHVYHLVCGKTNVFVYIICYVTANNVIWTKEGLIIIPKQQ